jgi:hypothetical protein
MANHGYVPLNRTFPIRRRRLMLEILCCLTQKAIDQTWCIYKQCTVDGLVLSPFDCIFHAATRSSQTWYVIPDLRLILFCAEAFPWRPRVSGRWQHAIS